MQRIFENRVFGKPFTISEANMMGQKATSAEFFPIMLSVAAFQNAAAFHAYTWSHLPDHSYGSKMFLDMRGNAKYLAHLPAAVNMFVRGDVKSGEGEPARIAYELRRADERNAIIQTGFARGKHIHDTDPLACLKAVTGSVLADLPGRVVLPRDRRQDGGSPYGRVALPRDRTISSTGELRWDATEPGREWYAVDTPRTKFVSMFGGAGAAHEFADGFKVTLGDTLMGWTAISFTELSPGRRLLAATGYQQASRAKLTVYGEKTALRPEDGITTLGKRITTMEAMGDVPYDCEGVRATIRIPAAGAVRVTPVDGNVRPLDAAFTVPVKDGFATFDISEEYKTVWYLVEP